MPSAQAEFGLNNFDVSFSREGGAAATAAGSHPHEMDISFGVNFTGTGKDAQPDGEIKDATFAQVPGLAINPTAAPVCPTADFLFRESIGDDNCPPQSQVGEVRVEAEQPGTFETVNVYNLAPTPGTAARLGFVILGVPVVIDGGISPEPPFNLTGTLRNTRQVLKVFGSELTLFGAEPGEVPFITLPTSCSGPAPSSYEALSWQGETDSGQALTHDAAGAPQGFIECEKLPFGPKISSQPTTEAAESATGLAFELSFDQEGLTSSAGRSQSALKDAVVTLPEGVTANPSIAEGLGVCAPADLERETLAAGPGEGCPNASKIGSVQVATPLLDHDLPGSVYIAEPDDPTSPGAENPFDSLIALYIVIKHPGLGVLIKLPARVEPDPESGRLVTTVTDAPQLPFSRFAFRFREGQRAPLITPATCGTYATEAEFTPWSRPGQSVPTDAEFRITSGPAGGPCPPGGVPPFAPGFVAGSANNDAGAFSPFAMRITRPDGHQDLTRLAAALPPGVSAKLAGLDQCPEALIALAGAKSARGELAAPSCPPGSLIGRTLAGAGVGGALTYVPGSLYLAGPFAGAPLSVVAVTPALAGPFDAGTVVVRVALRVDPRSAQVLVDGAASDPIPHILKGIPLKLRDLRVATDRPGFTLNPTSCAPAQTFATLWGSFLDVLSPHDDVPVGLASRYQAAGCASLGFKPKLAIKLKGGVRRGAHPALRAVVTPRPGDANFARAVVKLPTSAFLDQAHIRTICTRVQFAAPPGHGAHCPPGARYGTARAWSPLLDAPAQGPVYLRSSDNNLPDLVVALRGPASAPVELELSARIDSVKGGIRSSFEGIPDAPVSRFILEMQGGKKGLIVNSTNLCKGRHRANAKLTGQNGRLGNSKPLVRATKCPKAHHKRHSSNRKHNAGGQR